MGEKDAGESNGMSSSASGKGRTDQMCIRDRFSMEISGKVFTEKKEA